MSEEKMPFTQHLEELRKRLIISAIAIGIGFLIGYFFKERIFEWLMRPLLQVLPKGESQKLIYTAPHEAFVTYLKVSFIAGVGLASPVIIYQIWRFIAPGLYQNERRYLVPIVLFSTIFFLGGAMFGYFVVFPFGFQFFVSFANDFITPMISTREFTSFATRLLFAFGLVFEMPIFAFFLARIGLLNAKFMRKQRKYAILFIFVAAAVLTPPDVISQLLMAMPLLVLYEISVWIVAIFGKKAKVEEALQEKQPHSAG